MRTFWAYRRILGLGVAAAAFFALYITVIAPAAFSPGGGRPSSAAIGGLFARPIGLTIPHPFCTASVINSARGDLLITAAHCLGKVPVSQMVFIPYFHDGAEPFGEYPVTSQSFPPGWFPGGSIARDYAFLTVKGDVQKKAGAEQVAASTPLPRDVTVEGYDQSGATTVCPTHPEAVTRDGHPQLRFACPGFADASSGAPFLAHLSPRSGLGTIIGVLGGYQEGGATSSVSYASTLTPAAVALARRLGRARR
jgi:hypothetical protein